MIKHTIELATANVEQGGRPFACVIVKDGKVLSEAVNQVAQTHDPTAHAEVIAIREATRIMGLEHLTGCTFYILAHPCPMCLAAMYYCSPDKVRVRHDAGRLFTYYKDDRKYFTLMNFYGEIGKPWQQRAMPMEYHPDPDAIKVYQRWKEANS